MNVTEIPAFIPFFAFNMAVSPVWLNCLCRVPNLVAQAASLLYRRLPVGRPLLF
jgi:hypothetical protein